MAWLPMMKVLSLLWQPGCGTVDQGRPESVVLALRELERQEQAQRVARDMAAL